MSSSNCCFLSCIQVSQKSGNVVWYSRLIKNIPQFGVCLLHTWELMCGGAKTGPREGIIEMFQTFLVVQWLRIHLSMRGTQVWSLVQEDSTCCGATKPLHHNYWNLGALKPKLCKQVQREAHEPQLESSPPSPQLEKARTQSKDTAWPEINKKCLECKF